MSRYATPPAGLPGPATLHEGRAVFTEAYAVIPAGVQSDIVTSKLPGFEGTRAWILARPLTGFAETFAQYAVEIAPGGGSARPEPDPGAQAALFVTEGQLTLTIGTEATLLEPGGFAWIPPGAGWSLANESAAPVSFHWIRKRWQPAAGLSPAPPLVTRDQDIAPRPMPGHDAWATTLFMDPNDLRYDMAITIVTFGPGGAIPFEETHVMEHGLTILEGKAVYRLNRDWVEVGPGDFLWLRAFCPQACYAGGPGPFRYLLYKDINRHPSLLPPAGRPA